MSTPESPDLRTRHPAGIVALILGLVTLCATAGCDRTDEPDAALITGTVTSSEPITLPPAAVLELRLELASEDGTPAELLAVRREDNAGALPIRFTLEYDPAAVDASRRYAVSARVLLDDDVLMSSSAPAPVLTRGAPESVTLELKAAPPADAGGPKVEVVVTGDLQMGDSSARYRAVVVDDEVGSIEEEFSLGDYGSGVSRFWFEGARVVRYEEDSKKRLIDPARPEELVAVETRIEFDDSGALVAGEKRVGGEAVEVTPTDLSSVRNRADLLRSRALAQHAGTVHTSPHQPASNP